MRNENFYLELETKCKEYNAPYDYAKECASAVIDTNIVNNSFSAAFIL